MKAKDTKKAGIPLSRSCPHQGCRKRQIYKLTLNLVIDHIQICFTMPACVPSSYSALKQYTINSTSLIIQQPYQLESVTSLLREHELRFYYD